MWGGSVLSSLVPRDLLTLLAQSGTGVAHAHPAFSRSTLSSTPESPISSSHWGFWCGVPRPRLTPQPDKTVPAYLVGFSGGIQVEMSVSLSFIWWVTL